MPNTKEIKDRMSSIRDTRKITNAMYLIASTKLQKARRELESTRPFFDAIRDEIKRIFKIDENVVNRYFEPISGGDYDEGVCGVLVITADKGLAGAYNQNVLKEALSVIDSHENCRNFVVGEYGRQYFTQKGIPFEEDFLFTAADPTLKKARNISELILDEFIEGRLDSIYIVYTDMKSGLESEARSARVLPFARSLFIEADTAASEKAAESLENVAEALEHEAGVAGDDNQEYEFFPSLSDILDGAMPSYLLGYVYSAIVDSFCSEMNARMSAMDNANRNADQILSDLTIKYNRVRQAAITQEITEVSAGARAQKKKRKKQDEMKMLASSMGRGLLQTNLDRKLVH